MPRGLRIATYNILADAYINEDWYPGTPAALLEPGTRRVRLLEHVAALDADVLCLQEVERASFDALAARLGAAGLAGRWAQKGRGRPDGCSTFVSGRALVREHRTLAYDDGGGIEPPSGHVALLTLLDVDGRLLGVANTHLRWDKPGTLPPHQLGLAQARELLQTMAAVTPAPDGWVVCGDLNAGPESDVLAALTGWGLRDPHDARAFTSTSNGQAKRIDFVLVSKALAARPFLPPPLGDDTPLPSPSEPSDHLALVTEVGWTAG